jgi:hypothetical protein
METENEVKKTKTGVSPPFFHLVRSSVSPFRSVLIQHVHFQSIYTPAAASQPEASGEREN